MNDHHEHRDGRRPGPDWSFVNQWLLWLGLAGAVGWLFFRHNEHLFQLLPFLIVLACPLMHVFGHGGHGHRGDGAPRDNEPRRDDDGGRPAGHSR